MAERRQSPFDVLRPARRGQTTSKSRENPNQLRRPKVRGRQPSLSCADFSRKGPAGSSRCLCAPVRMCITGIGYPQPLDGDHEYVLTLCTCDAYPRFPGSSQLASRSQIAARQATTFVSRIRRVSRGTNAAVLRHRRDRHDGGQRRLTGVRRRDPASRSEDRGRGRHWIR